MSQAVIRHLDRVDRSLADLAKYLSWDDDRLNTAADDVSAWSVGQHFHHLAKVNKGIVAGVTRAVANPEKGGGEGLTVVGRIVLTTGRIPRGRGKAPEPYRAAERVSAEGLRALTEHVTVALGALRADASRVGAVRGRFRHPVFGFMTPAEWLRFMGIHNDHHLRIIRDVAATLP